MLNITAPHYFRLVDCMIIFFSNRKLVFSLNSASNMRVPRIYIYLFSLVFMNKELTLRKVYMYSYGIHFFSIKHRMKKYRNQEDQGITSDKVGF